MSTIKVDLLNEKTTDGDITIANTGNGDTVILPGGTGRVKIDGLTMPAGDGTVDQLMKTNGSGVLSFATAAAGGAWNLIGSTVASNDANITITGLDTTYDTYAVIGADLHPSSDAAFGWIRLGDSGGVDSGASDYSWIHTNGMLSNSAAINIVAPSYDKDNSDAQIIMGVAGNNVSGNDSGEGLGFHAFLTTRTSASTHYPVIYGHTGQMGNVTTGNFGEFGGHRLSGITVTQLFFSFNTGNIISGRLSVWGIAHD